MVETTESGEGRLWISVIYKAVEDAINRTHSLDISEMTHAWYWIFDEEREPFNTFKSLCDYLKLNSVCLREMIIKEAKESLKIRELLFEEDYKEYYGNYLTKKKAIDLAMKNDEIIIGRTNAKFCKQEEKQACVLYDVNYEQRKLIKKFTPKVKEYNAEYRN